MRKVSSNCFLSERARGTRKKSCKTILIIACLGLLLSLEANANIDTVEELTLESFGTCVQELMWGTIQQGDLSTECRKRLDKLLENDLFWETMQQSYFRTEPYDVHDLWSKFHSKLNKRAPRPRFTFEDFYIADAQKLVDVMSIDLNKTIEIVEEVLSDSKCTDITGWSEIENEQLKTTCHARELLNYAQFMDACTTAKALSVTLNESIQIGVYYGIQSTNFWEGLDSIRQPRATDIYDEDGPILHVSPITAAEYYKINLRSYWILEHCKGKSFLVYDSSGKLFVQNDFDTLEPKGVTESFQRIYDRSLVLAARLGDPLAIQSYLPDNVEEVNEEYWQMLERHFPALYHRYKATALLGPPRDVEFRLSHLLKAYRLAIEGLPGSSLSPVLEDQFGDDIQFSEYVRMQHHNDTWRITRAYSTEELDLYAQSKGNEGQEN